LQCFCNVIFFFAFKGEIIELSVLKDLLSKMHQQLIEEIDSFKMNREKDLLEILKIFFKEKCQYDNEVCSVYEGNIQQQMKFSIDDDFDISKNENHFR